MLLHLVKKDILLVKKYLLFTLLIVIAIPLFIMARIPEFLGFNAFLISVIFAEFMLYQYVSMAEMKYPKATALLCGTPYPRSMLIKARYAFLLLIFAYCYVAYTVLALFVPKVEYLTLLSILTALLITTILFGVYTPIQYKLGYERTKYFFSIVIVATPFILPALSKVDIKLDFSELSAMSMLAKCLILIVAVIAILCISLIVSIKIYSKKDLL
ncbi:ABC-2 transporter permease [Bacillus sp. Xin]|uniref:ABC-2 transporter permease n=1 Tax=unclassified Bacillus (in: firmicutes) TaxID=185979 RepID=UPI0015744732|nr:MULTISPECIES: ABC-2 transporter permease [unclassified Bacillus (in: firmicutes)]MBC6971626.1 ABC-2 transporter permease [Bacillus sp. Xin]NSW38977.1 ABC-2 transporter permease [Bacillus sp. Xin1]